MADNQEPIECQICDGKGKWQERVETDGEVEIVWHFCNTCNGKGYISEDDDTFNLGDVDDDDD